MMLIRWPVPLGGGRGRGDRDPALLLLGHPVHHGGALVNLPHLVGPPGVIEDALSRRRLTGVDVRHDPDVANFFEAETCEACVCECRGSARRPHPGRGHEKGPRGPFTTRVSAPGGCLGRRSPLLDPAPPGASTRERHAPRARIEYSRGYQPVPRPDQATRAPLRGASRARGLGSRRRAGILGRSACCGGGASARAPSSRPSTPSTSRRAEHRSSSVSTARTTPTR